MIIIEKDGSLTGYDANGNRFNHNYMEGGLYDAMLATRAAQIAAAAENAQNVATYNNLLSQIQMIEDAGRPHDNPPKKPQNKIVSDTGQVNLVDFVPPLADFKPLVATGSGTISTGAGAQSDKIDMIYRMVSMLFHQQFPGV